MTPEFYYRSRRWARSPWRRALNTASVPAYGLGCLLVGLSAVPISAGHFPGVGVIYPVCAGAFVMVCGVLVARSLLR